MHLPDDLASSVPRRLPWKAADVTISSIISESEGFELMEFIARSRELDRFFRMPGQSVALVYGRRRVGKSELIK